jgi:hypothetical protein
MERKETESQEKETQQNRFFLAKITKLIFTVLHLHVQELSLAEAHPPLVSLVGVGGINASNQTSVDLLTELNKVLTQEICNKAMTKNQNRVIQVASNRIINEAKTPNRC